jgi:hypothetical protein
LIVRAVNVSVMQRNALDGVASDVVLSLIIYADIPDCYCCTEDEGKPFTDPDMLANALRAELLRIC